MVITDKMSSARAALGGATSHERTGESVARRHKAAMNDDACSARRRRISSGRSAQRREADRALNRSIDLLVGHQAEIAKAVNEDFGSRSPEATALTDVAGSIGPLKFARDHLTKWMKPEKRKTTPAILGLFGAKATVQWQPKGVVGVISPWNFPVNLTFAPLAGILAAGNRAMIKPSEFTPATSDLLKAMFAKAFNEEEIAVFVGGPEVGQAFSGLAFDHLVFTGATSVAKPRDAGGGRKPGAGHAGTGRQEPGDPVARRRHGHGRGADHERQDPERRPDLPGARTMSWRPQDQVESFVEPRPRPPSVAISRR